MGDHTCQAYKARLRPQMPTAAIIRTGCKDIWIDWLVKIVEQKPALVRLDSGTHCGIRELNHGDVSNWFGSQRAVRQKPWQVTRRD